MKVDRRRRMMAMVVVVAAAISVVVVRCSGTTKESVSDADTACATGRSLVADCGFESPVVPLGGFTTFESGAALADWTVVGPSGNVAPLSATYTNLGLSWSAHRGVQTLDLTGLSNSSVGVSQSIATTNGRRYKLSFWVGNLVDPTGEFGDASAVDVRIAGRSLLTARNSEGAGGRVLVWHHFSAEFTATSGSTTLEFVNADPATDNSNIIDDIGVVEM